MIMPAHKVTEEIKTKVTALKSFGIPNPDIAKYLNISAETLNKYYQYELDMAQVHADYQIAGKLFKKAMVDEDLTAIIFWLKTRARWRTEDNKNLLDSNEEVAQQVKALRAELDAKNKKDF